MRALRVRLSQAACAARAAAEQLSLLLSWYSSQQQAWSKQILVGQAIFKRCWEVGGLTLGGQSPPYLGRSGGMLPRDNF